MNVTPVTVEKTVTFAENVLLWSVDDMAVTDTVCPEGTPAGAVKVEFAPLAVCAGEKDPQLGALPQIATQSTPALATSLLTVAETIAIPLTDMVVGGTCVRATEMIGVGVEFALALLEQPTEPRQKVATPVNNNAYNQRFADVSNLERVTATTKPALTRCNLCKLGLEPPEYPRPVIGIHPRKVRHHWKAHRGID